MAAVCPPDLEICNRACRRPVTAPFRKQQDVDEASAAQADVHEDPDPTGPGNLHDCALENLPEAQVPPNPGPLGVCHHDRIFAPTSGSRVAALGQRSPRQGRRTPRPDGDTVVGTEPRGNARAGGNGVLDLLLKALALFKPPS